jgi:DNA repair exonuclease SbcCD ATPase subunit
LRKIEALDPETVRTTDAANREIDTANKLAQGADALNAEIQDITDELSATESQLSDLVEATNYFNDYESNSIEQIDLLKERIGMLPATLQSTLKKSNDFKALASFQRQVETVLKSKDSILDSFTGVKRPSQITPSINSMNSLKSQLPSLNTLKRNLQALDKKIPAVVCQKGSLVVSASKTGKCAKGFEPIPTK